MKPTQIAAVIIFVSLAINTRAQHSGDANWVSLGGVNGADAFVETTAADGLENVYVGGILLARSRR